MESLFRKRKERLEVFQKSRKKIVYTQTQAVNVGLFACLKCKSNIPKEDLKRYLYICPKCGEHFKLGARERIAQISDKGTFKELDARMTTTNVDNFQGYSEKLSAYKKVSGLEEAVLYGHCLVDGHPIILTVMDSHFMMGSMGQVVGEKITRSIELATKKKLPLVIFCASGGARMQEGILSLMQMAKTSAALTKHGNAHLLYISVLTNPTTGGVSASFANLGDVCLAEPQALIGFAGKRVIEKTVNETLPEGFQSAEFLLEHGFIDKIVERRKLKETIARILTLHQGV